MNRYTGTIPLPIDRKLYHAIHDWLRNNYGKAILCEGDNCNSSSKNYEWAKVKGKEYDFKRKNFIQLCHSCHIKYDFTETGKAKLSHLHKGRRLPEQAYVNFRAKYTGVPRTKEVAEKISKSLTGRKYSVERKKQMSMDSINAKKTHCKMGHPFNEENTRLRKPSPNGAVHRECRECKRYFNSREYKALASLRDKLSTL